ncbi:MAG: hypothetical protein VW202_08195 [Halieaceae bacterium]
MTLMVEASELDIWVEDEEELYATYYGEPCINLDYDAAWNYYRETKHETE